MTVKQLSVFLENKPGALSTPCRLLAEAKINIQSFALADTQKFGIVRLVVHEWDKAQQILQANGFAVRIDNVVALEVPDQPGALAAILEVIEEAKVNVEYAYAFTEKRKGKAVLAFRFNKPEAAIQALQAKKINAIDIAESANRLDNGREPLAAGSE